MCCETLTPYLTEEEVASGKYNYSITSPSSELGLDPTHNAVITIQRGLGKGCAYFINQKCSIYDERPKACRQFDCRKDKRFSNFVELKFGK